MGILYSFLQVKYNQVGIVELYEETQTMKQVENGRNEINIGILGCLSKLSHISVRITNLIHIERHRRDLNLNYVKGLCTFAITDIISGDEERNRMWLSTQSEKGICKDLSMTSQAQELRDFLRGPFEAPKNHTASMGSFQDGNGVIVVRKSILMKTKVERVTVQDLGIRKLTTKAGQSTLRGSVGKSITKHEVADIDKFKIELNIKNIANIKNLVAAYELIKSNPGNMTKGNDNVTLDGMDLKYLLKIQEKLRAGLYKFPPARRIQIPKVGKKETRPLTIASPRDKIVQKAIQLVLNEFYEPKFLETSHGFRPGRGTHTAIQFMEAKFQSAHYIIEADFSKAFDKIPHGKMMEILRRDIKCSKTLGLINSGLKAGFIEKGKLSDNLSIGTPQGSILSPLLCNIYFHELDIFMEDLMNRNNKGVRRPANKEYTKLQNRAKYMRSKGLNVTNPTEYNGILHSLINTPSLIHDDTFTRVHYVRYADDFIIGVEGSYALTKQILDEVRDYLKTLDLTLNETKTKLTKYTVKPVEFLGYTIMGPNLKGIEKPFEILKEHNSGRLITRRKKIRIRIAMNYERVISRLISNGYIKKRTLKNTPEKLTLRGTFKGNLINLDHADIIRFYSSIIRGIYNYYNFVTNMNQVAFVIWLITESCCLTLAKKNKLSSMKKVFHKFGKDLGCNIRDSKGIIRRVSLYKPNDLQRKPIKELVGNKDPFRALDQI